VEVEAGGRRQLGAIVEAWVEEEEKGKRNLQVALLLLRAYDCYGVLLTYFFLRLAVAFFFFYTVCSLRAGSSLGTPSTPYSLVYLQGASVPTNVVS